MVDMWIKRKSGDTGFLKVDIKSLSGTKFQRKIFLIKYIPFKKGIKIGEKNEWI